MECLRYFKTTDDFIKHNQQLFTSMSDKDTIILIMNKKKYHNEVEKMLNDQHLYRKLQKDPTIKIQNDNKMEMLREN